jgi:hypothetical protein
MQSIAEEKEWAGESSGYGVALTTFLWVPQGTPKQVSPFRGVSGGKEMTLYSYLTQLPPRDGGWEAMISISAQTLRQAL